MHPVLLGIAVLLAACGAAPVTTAPALDAGPFGTDLAATDDRAEVDDDCPASRDDVGRDAARPGDGSGECEPGETRCGDACLDLSHDPLNCGACGRVCSSSLPHGRPFCRDRGGHAGPACEEDCEHGWRDCNHDRADGCETATPDGGACRPRMR